MAKQQSSGSFNFGDLSAYTAGGAGIQEGDYVMTDLTVKMHSFTKADGSSAGPARLGVMITFQPLGGGDSQEEFYSLGGKADQSWAPNPETGKGVVPVPGGPGIGFNESTNWAVFVKELFNSGLPQGILGDDLSVLEGTHVHVARIPEPESRKSFAAKTGEAGGEQRTKTIAVVTEIKDDGKPWEGTGGVKAAKKANGIPAGKVAAKPVSGAATKVAVPVPAQASASADEDLETIALAAASSVVTKFPTGLTTIKLKTSVFKEVSSEHDIQTANKVQKLLKTEDEINALINPLGFEVQGSQIVATA